MKKKRDMLPLYLILGIIIGAIIGVVFKEKAKVLKPLGDIFLNLMFTIVVPLVFVSISASVGNMVNMKRLGKILGSTIGVFLVTGLIASFFVLTWVNIFPPAEGTKIAIESAQMGEVAKPSELIVSSLTVSDFPELLSKSHMLPLIIFSILFGIAVSITGENNSIIGKFLKDLEKVVMKMVNIIMLYAPIGLGAYFANLIGELGPELIGEYGRVLLIYYPLVFIYLLIMFPIYSYWSGGKEAVKRMRKNILKPAITAFSTQSSAATIPANKEACESIGVPSDISDIVLPMGCTMHMDGSVLSSIIKISFLFGVYNMPFHGIETYIMSIIISILAAFVLSGAPGGGLVGEMLIVTLFGFPPEAFPIIATIGFLVDSGATMLNASGDTIASMMVTKLVEGKEWIIKTKEN